MRSIHAGAVACGLSGVLCLQVLAQQPAPGPIPVIGLTPAQRAAFNEGSRVFTKRYTVAEGLGPVFNDDACNDCHRNGGGSNRTAGRFGRLDRGVFDPLAELGGSLVQSRGIGSVTTEAGTHTFTGESTPATATVSTRRRSHTLLGLGLVDAVPDETWLALAQAQRQADASTAGRAHQMLDPSTGRTVVGKFGWKAQVPSLRIFSGDALLNEMGITNPLFRAEACPQGDCWAAIDFNPAPGLNDNGHDVDALTDFQTMLAPPPRGPVTNDVLAGEQVFQQIGCAICHRPTLRTGPSPIAALNQVDFHPYSDFLLHDMGSLGDGISQGQATGFEIRTQPLWGLRSVGRLMHDAATTGVDNAILRHDGQGRAARVRFSELAAESRAALLAFLASL
jgi:CxxC motif-containing protein (DUF1111 family)